MASGYCPTCGTEVDPDARFCPTCGAVLAADQEQPERIELPAAPGWPDQQDAALASEAAPAADPEEQLTFAEQETPAPAADPPVAAQPDQDAGVDLHLTWPTMLSGWLIGIGSAVGALSLLTTLGDGVSLVLFLALLGVSATIFLADRLPEVPRLRLLILSVSLVGLGIGFERAGFGARGAGSVLFVAMIAAAGGALLIELDRDRPLPPPSR